MFYSVTLDLTTDLPQLHGIPCLARRQIGSQEFQLHSWLCLSAFLMQKLGELPSQLPSLIGCAVMVEIGPGVVLVLSLHGTQCLRLGQNESTSFMLRLQP